MISCCRRFRRRFLLLAEATAAGDSRTKRTAIEVLEMLGPAAAPAAPALVASLADGDRFVRWSAVRALRNIGPIAARCATAPLACVVEDDDVDVRLAAAAALEQFAPAASARRASCRPPTFRVSSAPRRERPFRRYCEPSTAMTWKCVSPRSVPSAGLAPRQAPLPTLKDVFRDPNPRIRQAAAETMGMIATPTARDAVESLRALTRDEDANVRKAASEALLRIVNVGVP